MLNTKVDNASLFLKRLILLSDKAITKEAIANVIASIIAWFLICALRNVEVLITGESIFDLRVLP
jgi:hypothetical protein